jgi:hypothetical protein
MRLILALAIASLVGGSAVSAVKFFMSPDESDAAQLLENYRQNPGSTLKAIEASLSSCLPGRPAGEATLRARQTVAKLYVLMVDLKSKNASGQALNVEIGKWLELNAKPLAAGMSRKDVDVFLEYIQAAGKPETLSCITSRSV